AWTLTAPWHPRLSATGTSAGSITSQGRIASQAGTLSAPAPGPGAETAGESGSVALAARRPERLGRLDLLGEHPHVERTGRLVRLDVLALRLVALDEVAGRAQEVGRPGQANADGLGHHGAPELAGTGRPHPSSPLTHARPRGCGSRQRAR